jgi:hypothetical protein
MPYRSRSFSTVWKNFAAKHASADQSKRVATMYNAAKRTQKLFRELEIRWFIRLSYEFILQRLFTFRQVNRPGWL